MMTVIPAQVAGVTNICVACPQPVREILARRDMLGVDARFRMGGAQAIAAFAFGTATVPKADRIVGPGNIYVSAAKKLLAGEVGIDFVAGPTEILIIADEATRAISRPTCWLRPSTTSTPRDPAHHFAKRWPSEWRMEVERQLEDSADRRWWPARPSAATARSICARRSKSRGSCPTASRPSISPFTTHPASVIRHAGSVFIGPFSPEAAGDYASGPNHVLPTAARRASAAAFRPPTS